MNETKETHYQLCPWCNKPIGIVLAVYLPKDTAVDYQLKDVNRGLAK